MPYVADERVRLVKKRRWEDDDLPLFQLPTEDGSGDIYLLPQQGPRCSKLPRRLLPLSKRVKTAKSDVSSGPHHDALAISTTGRRSHGGGQIKPPNAATSSTLLTPCHICHRRPTKSSLDSFAECQGCGERTCFICLRDCEGWTLHQDITLSEQEALSRSFQQMEDADEMRDSDRNHSKEETTSANADSQGCCRRKKGWDADGHRGVVCSGCCVERGANGDVVCFGCLSALDTA